MRERNEQSPEDQELQDRVARLSKEMREKTKDLPEDVKKAITDFDFCGGGWASRSDGELLDMSVLTEKADLEAVLEEVKQWDFVDIGSIYLMGNSQGGLVTALTVAEHKEEIRAVILIYPVYCILP